MDRRRDYTLWNCKIPTRNILGDKDKGFELMNVWLEATRLTVAATSVARAERAFDIALDWSANRKQFGKVIGKFQGVSFKLADMAMDIRLANLILLGDILEEVDKRGNRILIGDIKNIGQGRADFAKINFVFRMNWQGKTKALTSFVKGSEKVFKDSNIQSDSSIEPDAIGEFELIIPPDFGAFIGYSYSLDWEQYDD